MSKNALAANGAALPAYSSADLAAAIERTSPRRGFLRGLASLPLIGGAVTLIGQPAAVAEPVTSSMLEAYKTWLAFEQRELAWELSDDPVHGARYMIPGSTRIQRSRAAEDSLSFIGGSGRYHFRGRQSPYERAALVLSAVGCDWREG